MGMTRSREGKGKRDIKADFTVALLGNPNVGKSTVFNALTGLRRHTGNWTGKTVDIAAGIMKRGGKRFALVDLPGCYSLEATSPEEEVALDFILSGKADCTVVVCDASCPERNLNLALQAVSLGRNVVICLNLVDEAAKHGVFTDADKLGELLGAEVIRTSAAKGRGLGALADAIKRASERAAGGAAGGEKGKTEIQPMWERAEEIAALTVKREPDVLSAKQLKLDRFLTGRFTGTLSMLLLLGTVLFITMVGANYPSALLGRLGDFVQSVLREAFVRLGVPEFLRGLVVEGGFGTLFTVVSVMLPPMAIFFPLFTLLEDLGLLPRIAFDLDRPFARCGSCGKCALTTCMGFGCNAAGVVGCRIIEDPRERLCAVLTNSLVPCNGRFPTLTALVSMFLVSRGGPAGSALGALWMTGAILVSVAAVFLVTKLLSVILPGRSRSSFVLELPPFRRPRVGKILVRAFLDRTLFVLGRAAAVAFPAGMLIWLLGNTGGETTVMERAVRFLDPFGRIMGVDGTVLASFALGLPANELVMPLMLSIYGGSGAAAERLAANGWTAFTAVQVMLLTLFHSPCAATLLTVKHETGSVKYAAAAFLIPTLLGMLLLTLLNGIRLLAAAVFL